MNPKKEIYITSIQELFDPILSFIYLATLELWLSIIVIIIVINFLSIVLIHCFLLIGSLLFLTKQKAWSLSLQVKETDRKSFYHN